VQTPVLVVGPGAIGLSLVVGLQRSGDRVAILGRTLSDEKRLVSGFHVTSPDGVQSSIRGNLISARLLKSRAQAAFFCVKSADAHRAATNARRYIGQHTPVIALQNGLGHEKIFRRAFGTHRTVIGVCYFAADRPKPGDLRLHGGADILLARHKDNMPALESACEILTRAGFRVHVKDNEAGMLWTKVAFNAAINPLGAACAVENGKLMQDPALRELSLKALAEAAAAAKAAGHPVDYSDMAEKLIKSSRTAAQQRNSMLQDLAAGRRTEVNSILGPLLAAARRHKVPVPTLSFFSTLILNLERTLSQ
jgi:2-dehydropantoate 2-reductase